MNIEETNDYLKSHGKVLPTGQIFLTRPLYGFKAVHTYDKSFNSVVEKIIKSAYSYSAGISLPLASSIDNHKLIDEFKYYRNSETAIANLIIPKGAIVNPASTQDKKLRANIALTWSIVRIKDKSQAMMGRSDYATNFHYHSAKQWGVDLESLKTYANARPDDEREILIRPPSKRHHYFPQRKLFINIPNLEFSHSLRECRSGIHFFAELYLAKNYIS